MFSHYLDRGIDLDKLTNLRMTRKNFYIASMLYEEEEKIKLISELISAMFGGSKNG
ncbi:hypothetical protein QUE_3381 [Clostridioides difficile P51]|uniref:hypothetical protein n=2 Tax=Peptostreptococcaceae TaxID=186804 RepID=UPI00038C78D1|nr:hypothetical protein [Clostridioides difficile]MCC0677296.1 hypothetical protein [Clostridioides sp. ES-W-0018-02]EQJ93864.1 hypothetical protein QUE_3381 [Clostridioides difficile P51]MBF9826580.1 hypothetical protein [Clostridioides difficile]MCP3312031.1 hypothetical protein [Clostridioides difficile]MDO0459744.1 hypothetical protein [Clostridioides difficile]